MTRKHALVLLAASTLTAAVGLPALGALADPAKHGETSVTSRTACPPSLASDDADRDEDDHRRASRDRDRDGECDDDDEDDCGGRAAPVPTAAGILLPNGLFGTGAPPHAKVN